MPLTPIFSTLMFGGKSILVAAVIVIQPRDGPAVVERHGNVAEGNHLPVWQSKIEIEIGRRIPDELRPDDAGAADGKKAARVLVLD